MKGKKINENRILFYIAFVGPFSIVLFLYGFFPVTHYSNKKMLSNDIPKFIEDIRIKDSILYRPMVDKMIIMVIDALRWDFVVGPTAKAAMPVTNNLLKNPSTCLLKAKVQAPTVTMPRIKAITTGTIPNFIDVALNFGSKSIDSDNILHQAKQQGRKLIFYGDNTWLDLFPTVFERYDGTSSFFVTDFTEVDNNVTRHIHDELHNDDWSIMILHYLGLDHIGHVFGPFSSLIEPKLKEMDDIIAKIQKTVSYWNERNESSIFIICGDHGMKDSGGHGGATLQETIVPLIMIGGQCLKRGNRPNEVDQLDMSATLSVLLGLPIPYSNIGSVIVDVIDELPVPRKLFILYYNSQQVHYHFRKIVDYESQYAHQMYKKAVKLHVRWLNNSERSHNTVNDIVSAYKIALNEMKRVLVNNLTKYDTSLMTIAMCFLCHILYIIINIKCYSTMKVTFKKIITLFTVNVLLLVIINSIWESKNTTVLFTIDRNHIILLTCIIGILFLNCYFIVKIKYANCATSRLEFAEKTRWIFYVGSLVHAISLNSSSFVEEEHQTWYFFWVTLLLILFYDYTKKLLKNWPDTRTRHLYIQHCMKLFLLLAIHRILRKLNSTGDKYAHLPSIAGWFMMEESKCGITILLITGLGILIWFNFAREKKTYKYFTLTINILQATCIYLYHMANKNVVQIPLYPRSSGICEVHTFWYLLIIYLVHCLFRVILTMKYNKQRFLSETLLHIIQVWITISALLHRPYNVILLPVQLIYSSVINTILKRKSTQELDALIHAWIGNVFYFYQGNSNSLANVNIAAGYVGLQSYIPIITGTFLVINTYSSPILAYLVFIYYQALKQPSQTYHVLTSANRIYMTWKLIPIVLYPITVTIHRHHLFIWSVFSPKLMYEATYFVIMNFVVLLMLVLVRVNHTIVRSTN